METRNTLSRTLPPRDSLRLLYLNTSRFDGNWRSLPHTHACSEIFYCVRGRGRFQIEGVMQAVEADDLLIVNPRVEHTAYSDPDDPLEYKVLGIEGAEFLFDRKTLGYTRFRCRDRREEFLFLLRLLEQELDGELAEREQVCQDLLEVLLVKLMRRASASLCITTGAPAQNRECAAAKRYLDEHFRDSISLDQLAAAIHINKYYLAHTFQKTYNISPINYLLHRRIAESKELLSTTDHTLSEISQLVGFSSPSYFSQSFRRLEGMSPIEYRRTAQRQQNRP